MKLEGESVLLRIFIGESDRHNGRPLYDQIVMKARELNCAGATVLRGIMGYGASSRLHSAKLMTLSEDMPVVIEIVDAREKIEMLIPFLDETITDGMVTMEKVQVIQYRHS